MPLIGNGATERNEDDMTRDRIAVAVIANTVRTPVMVVRFLKATMPIVPTPANGDAEKEIPNFFAQATKQGPMDKGSIHDEI